MNFLQRLGGPNEDSNMSTDTNTAAAKSPDSNSSSVKSVEPDNDVNNGSASESHTPPLPRNSSFGNRLTTPTKTNKSDSQDEHEISSNDKNKNEPEKKKANEWDMFADVDTTGYFNVRLHIFSFQFQYRTLIQYLFNVFTSILQSPTVEGKRAGGPENPSLTDNWDDAEGYYR